jgi:hypothetical protein
MKDFLFLATDPVEKLVVLGASDMPRTSRKM